MKAPPALCVPTPGLQGHMDTPLQERPDRPAWVSGAPGRLHMRQDLGDVDYVS